MMVDMWFKEVSYRFPKHPDQATSAHDKTVENNINKFQGINSVVDGFPDIDYDMAALDDQGAFGANSEETFPLGEIDVNGEEIPSMPKEPEHNTFNAHEQRVDNAIRHYNADNTDNTEHRTPNHEQNTEDFYDRGYANITRSYPSLQYDEADTTSGGIILPKRNLELIVPPKSKIKFTGLGDKDTVIAFDVTWWEPSD